MTTPKPDALKAALAARVELMEAEARLINAKGQVQDAHERLDLALADLGWHPPKLNVASPGVRMYERDGDMKNLESVLTWVENGGRDE